MGNGENLLNDVAKGFAMEIALLALLQEQAGNDRLWSTLNMLTAKLLPGLRAAPGGTEMALLIQDQLEAWESVARDGSQPAPDPA